MTNLPWDKKPKTDKPDLRLVKGGRPPGPREILTKKQQGFVLAILEGQTASDAYRSAYDAKRMSAKAIGNEATKLLAHPVIGERIRLGQAKKEEKAVYTGASLREFIIDRLHHEAMTATSDSARISALSHLGKVDFVGLFRDRVSTEDDSRTAEQIKSELEEKLREAFNQTG